MKLQLKPSLWILCLPLAFYLLALNPYLAPSTYDNVSYWEGARSLASSGVYSLFGDPIVDWPPGLSTYLAVPMFFGLESIWVAKIQILFLVFTGTWISYRVLIRYQYPHASLVVAFMLLCPSSLIWGSRLMTEWPFLCSSLGALWLWRRRCSESWLFASLCGLLIAVSLLTRYQGIWLLLAILIHERGLLLSKERDSHKIFAVFSGTTIFCLLWVLPLIYMRSSGVAHSDYYRDLSLWKNSSPLLAIQGIAHLCFHWELIAEKANPWVSLSLPLLTLFLASLGMRKRWQSGKWSVTDTYGLLSLLMVMPMQYPHTRYLIPIAPFVFYYVIQGIAYLAGSFQERVIWVWGATLTALSAGFLLVGNHESYSSPIYLLSPTPTQYYRGEWMDLYMACHAARNFPENQVLSLAGNHHYRYAAHFAGRPVTTFRRGDSPMLLLAPADPAAAPLEVHVMTPVQSTARYTLFRQ